MAANQPPWPREWLMTDERIGDQLWDVVESLPAGAGIVFRHYSLVQSQRLELGAMLARRAKERDLVLAVAGSRRLAETLDAAVVHNPDVSGSLPSSMAVHDEREARAAREAGAVLAFIAPVFLTRSHAGAPALGTDRALALARIAGCPAIALGGMDRLRFAQLESAHPGAFHGYAGIDCWLKNWIRT